MTTLTAIAVDKQLASSVVFFFFFFLSVIVKSIKKEQRRYNRNKQDFPPKEESGIKALCQTQKIQKRNYKEMDEKGKLCQPLALLTY